MYCRIKMFKIIAHKIKSNLKFSLPLSRIRNAVELNEWILLKIFRRIDANITFTRFTWYLQNACKLRKNGWNSFSIVWKSMLEENMSTGKSPQYLESNEGPTIGKGETSLRSIIHIFLFAFNCVYLHSSVSTMLKYKTSMSSASFTHSTEWQDNKCTQINGHFI